MKPGHTAGLVHTDNQANTQAEPHPDIEKACIILKARGEKTNAIHVINPIYFTVCFQRNSLGLKHCVYALCVCVCFLCERACMCLCIRLCTCTHSAYVRVKATHARINKETALVAYSQP